MKNSEEKLILPDEVIMSKIYLIRGQKVMLDSDLAKLYEVQTGRLNEQVKRNLERFPDDFMFQLSKQEFENLISQNTTSSWGGRRKLPYVFTEHGVLMLSSVLNSEKAISVNIKIMRVYVRIREMIMLNKDLTHRLEKVEKKILEQDNNIMLIFEYLKQFEEMKHQELEQKNRKQIGFNNSNL